MSAKVVFSKNAIADLNAIIDFISIDNERRGSSFVEELSARIVHKLSVFPESGVRIGDLRYVVFGSYVALYAYDAGSRIVTVAMVTEGHRNWRQQFEERH
jgi:plasmid stabilization system protein ParE